MKKRILALVLVIVTVLAAGCAPAQGNGDSDIAHIQSKGTLVVGITEYPPMDYKDDNGNWIGFDADFARLVAEELGVEVEFFVLSDWGQKFNELNTKGIDVIWNGMTISEDVLNNTSCSDPYVLNKQVVVMKADRAAQYTTAESILDLKFAVEVDSTCKDALVDTGAENYVEVMDMATAVMEVASGAADACVIDGTMAGALIGEGKAYDDLAVSLILVDEEYGIGCRKGSDLTAKINELIAKYMADGTLQTLADKYGVKLANPAE